MSNIIKSADSNKNKNQKQNVKVNNNTKNNNNSNQNNAKNREQKLADFNVNQLALMEKKLAQLIMKDKEHEKEIIDQLARDARLINSLQSNKPRLSNKNETKQKLQKEYSSILNTKEYDSWTPPVGMTTELSQIIYMIINPAKSPALRTPYKARRCGITKENSTPLTSFPLQGGKCRMIVSPAAGSDKIYVSESDAVVCTNADADVGAKIKGSWLCQNSQAQFQGSLDFYDPSNGRRHYSAWNSDTGYAPIQFTPSVNLVVGTQHLVATSSVKAPHGGVLQLHVLYQDATTGVFNFNGTTCDLIINSAGDPLTHIVKPITGISFQRLQPDNNIDAAGEVISTFSINVPQLADTAFQIPGDISHYKGYDLNNIKLFKASGTAIDYRVTAYSMLITNDSAALYNGGLSAAKVLETPLQIAPGMSFEQFVTSGDGFYNDMGALKKGRYNYSIPSEKMLGWTGSYNYTTPWVGTDWNMIYLLDYSVVASGEVPTRLQAHAVQTAVIEVSGPGNLIDTKATLDDPKYPTVLSALRDAYKCYENPTHEDRLGTLWQHITNAASGFYLKYIDGPVSDSIANTVKKEGPQVIAAIGRAAATQLIRTLDVFG